jgi:proteic killer suppression protein
VRLQFLDESLLDLARGRGGEADWSEAVVRGFRKVLQVLQAAADERDLYQMKSLHYEKLKGDRAHQRSLRINRQWRLIVELHGEGPTKAIVVVAIEDYH